MDRLAPIVRLAPAKLNLTLAVVGRRPDGYHALHSVMVPLALADRLSLAASDGPADSLHVIGADTGPTADNLVLRALAAARAAIGEGPGRPSTPALAARLEKRIPVAAGLAGGSSDAAAALDAALEAWSAGELVDADRRRAIAAALGSDVPFFLERSPAVVEGRGERVTALTGVRGTQAGVLLVTPAVAVPTASVFDAFDAGARGPDPGATRVTSLHLAEELGAGLDAGGLAVRGGVLAVANDLLAATEAVVPGLTAFRRGLARRLGRPVGQTGSGPTCWALYPSLGQAEQAAIRLYAQLADEHGRGTLDVPGGALPFVAATATVARERPAAAEGGSHDP